MTAAGELSPSVGTAAACRALTVSRATYYRRRVGMRRSGSAHRHCPRRVSAAERRSILDLLHSDRFIDKAPAEVYATMLDEGKYLCSERTMYRLLAEHGELRERRNQLRHPAYEKPELLATAPNQVWSWDIERHEAFSNRAVMKGHRRRVAAAARIEAEGNRTH